MNVKFEASLEDGVHYQLSRMAGAWQGIARTWFEPDVVADESPVKGTIRPVLGGRFLLHEYEGSFAGKPLQGIVIYGYDLNTGRFQSAWIDSFHMGTGIMYAQQRTEAGHFSVYGTYQVMAGEQQEWGWRTDMELEDDRTLLITAYNITPAGEETRATEIVYRRQ
ncbi:DUF1579 domain-containing protein [Taibaiella koreensis]|uniref:DUF1579 domain-containing protein n=1 Tax=Taibaiella koreensis TaxID=1268548 RepID=UPI000E59F2AA|nr:DUF1579 domain-containing protein [Taibaiella koreensis]